MDCSLVEVAGQLLVLGEMKFGPDRQKTSSEQNFERPETWLSDSRAAPSSRMLALRALWLALRRAHYPSLKSSQSRLIGNMRLRISATYLCARSTKIRVRLDCYLPALLYFRGPRRYWEGPGSSAPADPASFGDLYDWPILAAINTNAAAQPYRRSCARRIRNRAGPRTRCLHVLDVHFQVDGGVRMMPRTSRRSPGHPWR